MWDWDRDGKREFMGHVTLDVKRVIGQIMLLAGQASRVLKLEEELEETASGRLHMEIEFYSVADNAAKVNEAIEARAEAEVALEHAAKNDESTPSKNEVRDRKMEMMASMSPLSKRAGGAPRERRRRRAGFPRARRHADQHQHASIRAAQSRGGERRRRDRGPRRDAAEGRAGVSRGWGRVLRRVLRGKREEKNPGETAAARGRRLAPGDRGGEPEPARFDASGRGRRRAGR